MGELRGRMGCWPPYGAESTRVGEQVVGWHSAVRQGVRSATRPRSLWGSAYGTTLRETDSIRWITRRYHPTTLGEQVMYLWRDLQSLQGQPRLIRLERETSALPPLPHLFEGWGGCREVVAISAREGSVRRRASCERGCGRRGVQARAVEPLNHRSKRVRGGHQ